MHETRFEISKRGRTVTLVTVAMSNNFFPHLNVFLSTVTYLLRHFSQLRNETANIVTVLTNTRPKFSCSFTQIAEILPNFYMLFDGTIQERKPNFVKAGVHMKAVFWLGIMFSMQISRHFSSNQESLCSFHISMFLVVL